MTRCTGIASLMMMVAAAPLGWAQEPGGEEPRAVASRGSAPRVATAGGTISMDLVDANLEDVLKLLSQQAGLNFVAAEAVRDRRVTVYMDRVPIQTALQSLLDANNLAFRQLEHSDVFIVTPAGTRSIRLITKVYALKYARVLPTAGETAQEFGRTGSLIQQTLSRSGTTGGASSTSPTSFGGAGGGGGSAANQGLLAIVKQVLTEHGSVTIDPRTNSLAITDVPESFATIEAVLAKLDVKPAQLFLEAEVLEVTLGSLRRLGIEFGSSTGTLATFTGPSRSTDFPLGEELLKRADASRVATLGTLSFTSLTAVLQALATETSTKILASPRLMTLSNEVAEIRIVAETATAQTQTSQTQTGTVTEVIERNTVGTVLRVTPLVTDNRHITMVIEPEVSRTIASSTLSNVLDPHRRAARTTVMVEDGQTVMIAGLLSRERELSRRKLPILGDLPFIGAPFRRSTNTDTETEIVIFITPHILPDGPATPPLTIPAREQAPLSTQEQAAYEHHREEVLRQRRITETLDMLTHH